MAQRGHDADDLGLNRLTLHADLQALPNRIDVAQVSGRERLADHHHPRRRGAIALLEQAALQRPHLHDREIVR